MAATAGRGDTVLSCVMQEVDQNTSGVASGDFWRAGGLARTGTDWHRLGDFRGFHGELLGLRLNEVLRAGGGCRILLAPKGRV